VSPYIIALPHEGPPLSANQRMHWRQRADEVRKARAGAKVAAQRIPPMLKCRVELIWYVTDRRVRDEDNLVPYLKALCDGLVDAGLVQDDRPEFMKKMMPEIIYVGKVNGPFRMELRIVKLK
jgi:crossover junction endodeoxyribonuclease RusA